jgi:hypothetical protein
MVTKTQQKKSVIVQKDCCNKKPSDRPLLLLRFLDEAHKNLCTEAKNHAGIRSMNSWIAQVTLAAARKELGKE